MMTVADILARRSVRKFTNAPVTEAQIQGMLDAAMAAPSAMHCDPWHFIVVQSQEMRDKLADALPYGQMLRHAPLGIIVCGDMQTAHRQSYAYMMHDTSAAIQNLLLAAHAQGLGAVWLGIQPNEDRITAVTETFGLPDGIVPVSAIAIGVPAESPEPRTRFDAQKVHQERW
jgi:nitroreductase